jgi:hypothetical protein
MMSPRLAKLIADAAGIIDGGRQATYAGGLIPRDWQGELMIEELFAELREAQSREDKYESVCIRITGGFDD